MVRETVAMETFALWATVLISMSAGFLEPRLVLVIVFGIGVEKLFSTYAVWQK
jgi:hypothetical protein